MTDLATPAAATTPAAALDTPSTPAAAPSSTPPVVDGAAATPPAAAPTAQPGTTALTATTQEPAAAAEEKAVAPETYEFTAPEGVTLDNAALERFTPLFKEANLTQETAQKLVTEYASYQQAQIVKQAETWLAESKADKEIGGQSFDANAKEAQQAFAKYGDPALKQFLEQTGLGNHPALLKMFVKIQRASAEDKHVQIDAPSKGQTDSFAKKLFPDMK